MIPGTGTRYLVPGIYSKQSFAAGSLIVLLYEKGDAVRIEPRPPSPNTCRLCARSSRTLFRPQAGGDGTRMEGVLGESRASYRLSINSRAGSNSGSQQQQFQGLVDNSWRWLTHPPHRPPPIPYREFLAEGRASVGLYATPSVCLRSSWSVFPRTSCCSRVLCHAYCCCGTRYTINRLLYNSIAYKSYQLPGNYVIDQIGTSVCNL